MLSGRCSLGQHPGSAESPWLSALAAMLSSSSLPSLAQRCHPWLSAAIPGSALPSLAQRPGSSEPTQGAERTQEDAVWAAQPALLLRSFLAALPGHFYAIITFNLQPRGRRALATHRGPRIRTRLMPNDKNKSLWLHCHPRTQRSKDVLFLPTAQSLRSPADQRGPGGPDRTGRPGGLRLRCQSRTGRTRGGWLRLKGCHWLPVPKRHRDSNRRRPTATLVRVIARPAQVAPYQKDTLASSISNKGRRAALLPHAPHLPPSRRGPTVQARATARVGRGAGGR